MREYVWYDPTKNELIVWPMSIADCAMSALRKSGNIPAIIKKVIVTSKSLDSGRLVAKNGQILEFVGEL